MDTCGICHKPADQLFETIKEGVHACFKCQPLVPEVTFDDNGDDNTSETSAQESAESAYYCGLCHKTFQKNQQLQNHIRNHKAERRFVCTYCSKAFSQSNNLRAHLRIHTNERPFKCNECGKAFTQVTNLNNHVRLHTGERPFVCDEPGCDKAFAQVTNLNQHRKRHLSGRPIEYTYDCNVCGEQFAQRNHMTNHRRLHNGERPFACEEPGCDKAFAQAGSLNQHRKSHLPRRPAEYTHDCNDCGERFSQRNILLKHRRTVHGSGGGAGGGGGGGDGKTIRRSCAICDVSFPNERMLQAHAAQHAPGEIEIVDTEKSEYPCVFSTCGMRFSTPAEHTDHLLRAHQLRVLATAANDPPKRGRPPKAQPAEVVKDPLELEETIYPKVKIIKQQYLPKLKVQSLFQ